MRSKLFFLLHLGFLLTLLSVYIKADDPLPPPADYAIKSANGNYEAFFSVKDKKTTVYELSGRTKKEKRKLWEMEGWFRNTFLSNDGNNLVIAYEGANLLDENYKADQIMISFYEREKLLKTIRLNELIESPTPENLEKTVSHYKWVETYGINEKQQFKINTIKKKKFLFDIKTGNPIDDKLYTPSNSISENQNASPQNPDTSKKSEDRKTNSCAAAILAFVGIAGFLAKR